MPMHKLCNWLVGCGAQRAIGGMVAVNIWRFSQGTKAWQICLGEISVGGGN